MGQIATPLHPTSLFTHSQGSSLCASQWTPRTELFSPIKRLRETPSGLDITPLGLIVNLSAATTVDPRTLLDGILQEVKLRSGSRQKRPVQLLEIHLEASPIEATNLTELIYYLGRSFRLAHNGNHHFRAHLNPTQADEATLALLKGLGFNQLYLHADPRSQFLSAGTITHALQLAQRYQYTDTAIKYRHLNREALTTLSDESLYNGKTPLQHLELALQQDTPEQQQLFYALFDLLRAKNFRVLGNDCFVSPKHALAQAQLNHHLRITPLGYNTVNVVDICGLGPGSLTRENYHFFHNVESTTDYLQQLGSGKNPVSHTLSLPNERQLTQLLIDQLLCYHRLDLGYLESRYQVDIEQLLRILETATTNGQQWFHYTQPNLTLTPEGILHLNSLCQALICYGSDITS
jgi:oxygen-independent coproporphyrinogen III oxidase